MAFVQEDVQVLFDEIESSDGTSDTPSSTSSESPRNFHQEQYESYVPPHKRGHNVQPGDKFVNHKKNNDEDRKEGTEHDKYQRLMLPVPFALPKSKLGVLKHDFPGVFFHCRDNGNHDHPFSHVVTMIASRFCQRRIKPGARILDVYGNPNACDRFNASQSNATEPKLMKALFQRCGPPDFIREVNKVGPFFDPETGDERYHRGNLMSMVHSGEIAEYDVLQFIHTLYYVPFEELAAALHAPGKKRVAFCVVHRHNHDTGAINDGEQTYVKKWVGDVKLVKQVNVSTGSSYVHPDLTPLLFSERKVWLPQRTEASRSSKEDSSRLGLAWECHIVNEETWVVEIVPYVESELPGIIDYAAMWDDDEFVWDADPLATPEAAPPGEIQFHGTYILIPTADGKFVTLDLPNTNLFNHLRMRASGRDRTPKLLEELITTANHLVNPSTLFGDKVGMKCPPDKIYDVAVGAWAVDIPKETLITDSVTLLRPVLLKHARGMKLGPKYKDLCLRDLMSVMRTALTAARDINSVVRAKDPLDLGLSRIQGYIDS